jgi:integrase
MMIEMNKLRKDYAEDTFVSFDENGNGLSRICDDVWDFNALNQTTKEVRFTGIKDLNHRSNAQRYVAAYLDYLKRTSETRDVSISKLWRTAINLNVFASRCNLSDLSLLSNDRVWRDFKSDLKGHYSMTSLGCVASSINALSRASLCERIFPKAEYAPLANQTGSQQAIAIPPAMHAKMLRDLVKTIDTYYPHRHAISKAQGDWFANTQAEIKKDQKNLGGAEVSLKIIRKSVRERMGRRQAKQGAPNSVPGIKLSNRGTWVSALSVQCYIVVGLFSGARDGELLSMTPNSYKLIKGIPTLSGSRTKDNNGRPITRTWVTHPIALKALRLAHDISQYARDAHTEALEKNYAEGMYSVGQYDRLKAELEMTFISVSLARDRLDKRVAMYLSAQMNHHMKLDKFNLTATEDDIREFDLLNPDRFGDLKLGGTLPKLSPHDLRRSFAVFMVRNRLGGLQAIMQQYGHKNIQMSGWYANNAALARIAGLLLDSELMEMCDDAFKSAAVDALDEIYNGPGILSGRAGVRITKEKEAALRRGEQIVLTREELEGMIESGEKAIVLLPTGAACTNPSCERICAMSFFSPNRKPCENEIITDRAAKEYAKERLSLIESFRGMNDFNDYGFSSILAGQKQKILQLEHTLKTHKIEFEPFIDRINVVAA